ncbi:MAG TPA: transcription termination factor NusA [Fimbriiglobus sp.]|nr:transcription termination factor NusA [Fimbriiglobus sp.]
MAALKKDIGKDILKLVDAMHEEKKIPKDVIFGGIESAIQLAAERHFGIIADEEPTGPGVYVHIDRATGDITAKHGEDDIDPETLGRIAAQSAKQVMIQKIREAESDTVFNEFTAKKGELVVGTIQRIDAGTAIVSLGKSESLLPRSEQIPGETHHVGERVKAVVFEVRKTGHRVKIVLSRAHPDFVKSLFEEEIPEIEDRTIDIRQVAREAGYRSKVAVSSIDLKVDCVGACVGVRGSRIKNIIEELNGERIDIVRWNDSLQVLIPNALQPAQISDVFTYPRLGRAIVLVTEDQLSLAIGRRGQNVRLASKLVGMDIEIMTHDELGEALERGERWFRQLPVESAPEDGREVATVPEEAVQAMIEEGFLSYNELTFIDAEELMSFTGLTEDQALEVLDYAEQYADHMDRAAEEERRVAEEAAEAAAAEAAAAEAAAGDVVTDTDPATAGPDAASFVGEEAANVEAVPVEGEAEAPAEGEAEGVTVVGDTEESPPAKPAPAYREGMPTDSQAMEEALIHEEERSGEDGETTARAEEGTGGASA